MLSRSRSESDLQDPVARSLSNASTIASRSTTMGLSPHAHSPSSVLLCGGGGAAPAHPSPVKCRTGEGDGAWGPPRRNLAPTRARRRLTLYPRPGAMCNSGAMGGGGGSFFFLSSRSGRVRSARPVRIRAELRVKSIHRRGINGVWGTPPNGRLKLGAGAVLTRGRGRWALLPEGERKRERQRHAGKSPWARW
jgi:hypothetical protein